MGKKDWRQLGPGWYFLEQWEAGKIRWTSRSAEAYLAAGPGNKQIYLRLFSGDSFLGDRITGSLKLAFSSDRFSFVPVGEAVFDLPAGIWTDVKAPIKEPLSGNGIILVQILVDQNRIPAELVPDSRDTRELGLAVSGMAVR